MIISWLPFCLGLNLPFYKINILGVFLLSILGIFLIEMLQRYKQYSWSLWVSLITVYFCIILILDLLGIIPEGLFGVSLPIVFYFLKGRKIARLIGASLVLLLMSSMDLLVGVDGLVYFIQFFSLFSIILIALYNENKGKINLKYLFYIGYPTHLIIYYLITLII